MKLVTVIILLLSITLFANGQAFDRATTIDIIPAGMYVHNGKIFIAGSNSGQTLVSRLNSSGVAEWEIDYSSTVSGVAVDIAGDKNGNMYVAGNFSGDFEINGKTVSSSGFGSVFIARILADGTVDWLISAGGANYTLCEDISTDDDGNLLITGDFFQTAGFGPFSKTSAGGSDIFLAKCDSSGNFVWVQAGGGTGSDQGKAIIAANGKYWLAASYSSTTITFGGQTLQGTSGDGFLAEINPADGNATAVKYTGGVGIGALSLDSLNNLYVTGIFVNPAMILQQPMTPVGSSDIFTAKILENGTLAWVKKCGGPGLDYPIDMAVNAGGDVFVTGGYSDDCDFNGVVTHAFNERDFFVMKYDKDGDFKWVRHSGGTGDPQFGIDEGTAIALDPNVPGAVHIGGTYQSGPMQLDSIELQGFVKNFYAHLSPNGVVNSVLPVPAISILSDKVSDGVLSIFIENSNQESYLQIVDLTGKLVYANTLSPGVKTQLSLEVTPGLYIVRLNTKDGQTVQSKYLVE